MPIPQKILTRKDEITADFLKLYHAHLQELFAGKASHRMTASDYASKLFIHQRHLTNMLKVTTGKSPCEFMENAVTAEAMRLLSETDLSIAGIATVFAYGEPTNFTKFFRGMAGMTPLQYRKQQKEQAPAK